MKKIVNLIYEAAVVKRLKRTGWQILGDNEESLGEHIFMTAVIAYLLGKELRVNLEKVVEPKLVPPI
jgi:5'-deoxynucleotidase YfbR-like HD superfamily hydrolase